MPMDRIPSRYGGGWGCPGILTDGTDCGYELDANGQPRLAAAAQPEPGTVPLDAALLHQEVRRLYAALERLASDEWLGTQGYSEDELQRRVEFAQDKLDAAPQGVPGLGN